MPIHRDRHTLRPAADGDPGDVMAGFGVALVMDLHGCDPDLIADGEYITTWARQLVQRIDMVPFGDPILAHFGHANPTTSGYTVVQLIETSSIVAHFSEGRHSVHIDVFSCKPYDTYDALTFTEATFKAQATTYSVIHR